LVDQEATQETLDNVGTFMNIIGDYKVGGTTLKQLIITVPEAVQLLGRETSKRKPALEARVLKAYMAAVVALVKLVQEVKAFPDITLPMVENHPELQLALAGPIPSVHCEEGATTTRKGGKGVPHTVTFRTDMPLPMERAAALNLSGFGAVDFSNFIAGMPAPVFWLFQPTVHHVTPVLNSLLVVVRWLPIVIFYFFGLWGALIVYAMCTNPDVLVDMVFKIVAYFPNYIGRFTQRFSDRTMERISVLLGGNSTLTYSEAAAPASSLQELGTIMFFVAAYRATTR
jgi:hypothetical protein